MIDDIFDPDFLQYAFEFPKHIKIDKEKLILSGHQFGGATAIGAACTDRRIKMCLPMDPWLFPYKNTPI